MRSGGNRPGDGLRRVLMAQGRELSPEDATELLFALLRLAEKGLLVPAEPSRGETSPDAISPEVVA